MNSRLILFSFFAAWVCLSSCKESNGRTDISNPIPDNFKTESNHPAFVTDMEDAHKKGKLLQNEVVCFNLDMTFGQSKSKMKIFTTPTSSGIRVDKKEGASTVMLNGKFYTDADSSRWMNEKRGIFTYQYFFMAPYKFSDDGTKWEKMPDLEIEGENTHSSQLTFEPNTGDAPDDWYIVHSDPESNRVRYIGYIVTGGGSTVEEAEKHAHAIKYSEYKDFAGIPFATKWEFFDYIKGEGIGKKIGEGIIKNIEMMDNVDQFDIINDGTYTQI